MMTVRTLRLNRNRSLHLKDTAFCPLNSMALVACLQRDSLLLEEYPEELKKCEGGLENKKTNINTKILKLKTDHKIFLQSELLQNMLLHRRFTEIIPLPTKLLHSVMFFRSL